MRLCVLVGIDDPFDPEHAFVTSWLVTPKVLAAYRSLLGTYALLTAILNLAYSSIDSPDHGDGGYFSYFTDLTYLGIVAWFIASAVQTVMFVRRGETSYPLQTWPRPLKFLHSFLFSTIATFPIIVTIVFWAILYTNGLFKTTEDVWSNVSIHAMNTLFILIEVIFTNINPMPWLHLLGTIIILALYLALAYISHATRGYYVYGFLDPSVHHGVVAGYVFGILVGQIIIFCIIWGIIRLRKWLTTRGKHQKSASNTSSGRPNSDPEMLEEWQEVGEQPTTLTV